VIRTLAIENYRSLRQVCMPLAALNLVTGANGSGKSSLYRALRLLADNSRNGAVAALAREGGLASTLWAGPEKIGRSVREGRYPVQGTVRSQPVSLKLGFGADDFSYSVEFGLPPPSQVTAFALDPEIKRECIWNGPVLRASALLCDRHNGIVRLRGTGGARGSGGTWSSPHPIGGYDSMLSEFADPQRAPEMLGLREQIRSWRFYDYFRTDVLAPARGSHIATRTPVLAHDGADVAAALQTIHEVGDAIALERAVDLAFPGSRISIESDGNARLDLRLRQHGLLRPLGVAELSDGTLRYLLWIAALLTPRPPGLLVLNEPETSLHSDLLAPLARLISDAAAHSQIIVVSHSRPLMDALGRAAEDGGAEISTIELSKDFGETRIVGQDLFDQPSWHWPKRLIAFLNQLTVFSATHTMRQAATTRIIPTELSTAVFTVPPTMNLLTPYIANKLRIVSHAGALGGAEPDADDAAGLPCDPMPGTLPSWLSPPTSKPGWPRWKFA
jgi:predicted ATPase